jgi:alkylation response protein AidB-like acyl-CoA dehydrogenase
MSAYRAPVTDIVAALDVAGLDALLDLPQFSHVDRATVQMALAEFGRFAAAVIAPTDQPGDVKGIDFDPASGSVTVPEEFHKAYRGLVEGGWTALAFPKEWGGGGFPTLVGMALQEMLASANVSLSLNPVLTQSAVELLLVSGTESQKTRFLPRLLTGEWSGTMNLTEPAAGSDLGEVRTLAEPDGDQWRLTGTKVFITWGEHDLTENIVHLVLARTPGAPPGTRGLSIFLAPRYLVDDAGEIGKKNAITCVRVEHKLGLHASPTCVLEFERATAELVGPLHGGMSTMFTMMNTARLSIGMQGPSIGEVAYQQALEYAHTRSQGKAPGTTDPDRSLIVDHPDVRRMLLTMRVLTVASRMLVYAATGYKDLLDTRARQPPGHRLRSTWTCSRRWLRRGRPTQVSRSHRSGYKCWEVSGMSRRRGWPSAGGTAGSLRSTRGPMESRPSTWSLGRFPGREVLGSEASSTRWPTRWRRTRAIKTS